MKHKISFYLMLIVIITLPMMANAAVGQPVRQSISKEVVFIDSTVPDYQQLLGLLPGNVEVRVITPGSDGLQQIADYFKNKNGYKVIHLVSHGSVGELQVGTVTLSNKNIDQYVFQLKQIGQALEKSGDLLLYGCNIAKGSKGQDLIHKIALLTDADVAASANLTGTAAKGGDWVLEARAGKIENRIVFTDENTKVYRNVLSVTVTNLDGDVLNYMEGQNQTENPALVDASGNATVTGSGWNNGKLKIEFIAGSTDAQDSFYFGNYGTGAGQIQVGYVDNGSGSYGNYVKYSGTVIGTCTGGGGNNGAPIELTFNASATNAAVKALVNNLRYSNSESYFPSTATRTVRFTFTDATGSSTTATTTINVAGVNDAPKFMGAGFAATDFGTELGYGATGHNVAQQADGKYLAVVDINDGVNWVYHVAVARYNMDGTLDPTFGTGGFYHSSVGNVWPSTNVKNILIRNDGAFAGKILVSTTDSDGMGDDSIVLFQLNSDGTLDTTFGTNGICRFNAVGTSGESLEEICDIAQQPDGKIVAVGSFYKSGNRDITLWRFKADGSGLDMTFNGIGYVSTNISGSYSYGFDVLIQPDGKIILAGVVHGANNTTDPWDLGVRRYNSNGSLDTTFGNGGMAQLDYADSNDDMTQLAYINEGPNAGKLIVAGGYTNTESSRDLTVARLNANGTLDTTFGTNGWQVYDIVENNDDNLYNLTLDGNNNIILVGYMGGTAAVIRLTENGILDTTFDGDGKLLLADIGESPCVNGVMVDNDGKIILTGCVSNAVNNPLTGYQDTFGMLIRLNPDGTLAAMGVKNFTEGGPAVVLDSDVQVYDGELGAISYNGSTLTVAREGGSNTEDAFEATGTLGALTQGGDLIVDSTNIGTVTTNSGGTLFLTFNSNATNTLVNRAIRQIGYKNNSYTPTASVKIVMTFSDQNSGAQGTGGVLIATAAFVIDNANVDNGGDSNTTITAGSSVTEPVSIPTTAATMGSAVNVFDFVITDAGTTDGLSTDIAQVKLSTSGTGNFNKVTWRLNGPDVDNVVGTYDSGSNTITFSGLNISVADGANENYTVNAYYSDNTGLTDRQTYILAVNASSCTV
ncbi:MAG TPA: DUF4347 domain-containing protein, partial [Bacillota bacterium]|nr:DUF4347 domain-containing protein [Bacillota bacterium]